MIALSRMIAIAGIGIGVSIGAVGIAQAQEVTLRLALSSSKPHPFNTAADLFAAKVDELSEGSILIDIFPDRQLGDVKELTEGVRFGTVDMTINSSSAMADQIPAIEALQLPFLIDSYAQFADAATTPEAQALYADLESSGAIALTIYEGGMRHFLTVDKKIEVMEDFSGLKTRVAPVRLHLDIWNAVGVNPTPMAYGEVYTALETQTIDAVETNISSIEAEKYNEVAKEVLLTGHYMWPGLLMMNKAKYDSLTPEQQEILQQAALETVKPQIEALQQFDEDLMVKLEQEDGLSFATMSPELKAELREAVAPVYEQYVTNHPAIQPFLDAVDALRESN
ncbi:TRAP transporter substrate-binding protein [Chelativorans sp. Marseille-P2723]|uniref:TRAP transporter substrate-binding protein n=1 Tax=Chelativorans sp. Marseille-P2723 TaxID=2709133 RepID=UPI00157044EB|nr:TRAP transporter substrate-binding protein [Chelativorans sp. Marseille-P2723]